MARRHVDQELADFPAADGLQMLADGIDVPAVAIRCFGLQYRPCRSNEINEMPACFLGPYRLQIQQLRRQWIRVGQVAHQ